MGSILFFSCSKVHNKKLAGPKKSGCTCKRQREERRKISQVPEAIVIKNNHYYYLCLNPGFQKISLSPREGKNDELTELSKKF